MSNPRIFGTGSGKRDVSGPGDLTARSAGARSELRLGVVVLAAALLSSGVASAQIPAQNLANGSPFEMTGFIQTALLDSPADVMAGGRLIVNGITVTVPRNTILQMPAFALTWQQLFTMAPLPYGPTQTGLAMTDNPPPLGTYEVTVLGNRIGDTYIAGLLFMSQASLQGGSGFINFIDYANAELRVGGIIGNPATGARLKINDPIARFAPQFLVDQRFQIDSDNPTIRTETAFPMCFPHQDPATGDDPLCPQRNRPLNAGTGFPLTVFTMQPGGASPGPSTGTNPWVAAPFKIGDFIVYAGTRFKDGPSPSASPLPATGIAGTYIAAHTIIANLGLFTAAGTNPAYVATDVMLLGVGGAPIPGFPQEATIRTRFEGFTTDASRIVSLWGIDENCANGSTVDRDWGTIDVDQGPPTGAVQGRWRFRPPDKILTGPAAGTWLPATRMMRSVLNGAWNPATPLISNNGLITGQYAAPIFEYLFPEALGIGNPPVPFTFNDFPFLVNGTFSFAGATAGQLSPWPGMGFLAAPPSACAPATDVVRITAAEFSTSRRRLTVTATTTFTTSPLPTLTLTGVGAPRVMSPLGGAPAGTFQIVVNNVNRPASVTVTSSAGGTATSGITRILP